jgi:hypothetical protein
MFAEAVKRDSAARCFLANHNIHFTPEGDRLLADWLERRFHRCRDPKRRDAGRCYGAAVALRVVDHPREPVRQPRNPSASG